MSGWGEDVEFWRPVRQDVVDHPMATFVARAYASSWMTIPFLGGPIGSGPSPTEMVLES